MKPTVHCLCNWSSITTAISNRALFFFARCYEEAERHERQLFLSAHTWLARSEEEKVFVRNIDHHAVPSRYRLFDSWRGGFQASAKYSRRKGGDPTLPGSSHWLRQPNGRQGLPALGE